MSVIPLLHGSNPERLLACNVQARHFGGETAGPPGPAPARTIAVNEILTMLPWVFGLVAAAAAVSQSK